MQQYCKCLHAYKSCTPGGLSGSLSSKLLSTLIGNVHSLLLLGSHDDSYRQSVSFGLDSKSQAGHSSCLWRLDTVR